MKIADCNGYEVHIPTSGGKAGTGFNKTSTIQVRLGNMIVKQFRFTMDSESSRRAAMRKAREYCEEAVEF